MIDLTHPEEQMSQTMKEVPIFVVFADVFDCGFPPRSIQKSRSMRIEIGMVL